MIFISWGGNLIPFTSKIFLLFITLSLLSTGILAVLSKKQSKNYPAEKEYVKISKIEYEQLLKIKREIEEMKGSK